MSLTYGYDLKDNDDRMIAAPVQATEMLSRLILPGAVLVNHLPFCANTRSVIANFGLTDLYSAAYPFVGSMVQLRVTGTDRQRSKFQDDERALQFCEKCYGS